MARRITGIDEDDNDSIDVSEELEETFKLIDEMEGEDDGKGGLTFNIDEEEPDIEDILSDTENDFYENLIQYLDQEELDIIGSEVVESAVNDKSSNEDYYSQLATGMGMLGLGVAGDNPLFKGACSATHPVIIESAVKFQAKAASELFPANGPVRTQILGEKTPEREMQAKRIKEHMNYQTTTQMEEYFPQLEKLLFYLPLMGSALKKIYYDENLTRPCSEFIRPDKFYINFSADDLPSCPRYTHLVEKTENDLRLDFVNGLYEEPENWEWGSDSPDVTEIDDVEEEIMGSQAFTRDDYDGVYSLYEQHVDLYIEGDPLANSNELASPYIITVDADTETVLAIRRNWKQGDMKRKKRVWFVHYTFVPGMGFFGLGYIHLLANFQATLTSVIRSLVDAGQFANLQGGFKAKGLRVVGDNNPISPGEWRDVEAAGLDLTKALLPLPYKEPSVVLFQLLQFLDARVQKFADTAEQVVADSTNYGPVGTTLALLDASQKFFSGIHKRLHYSQKQEFRILADLNSEYLDETYYYDVVGATREVQSQDYNGKIDIVPVSDPNISSNAHRMALAQAKMQTAQMFPTDVNRKAIVRDFFVAMGDENNIEKYVPSTPQPEPLDPLTDIMMATQGKPIKAFPGQDHDAHIQAKTSWMQDPMGGAHQFFGKASPAIMANIREHMMLRYQEMAQAELRSQGKNAQDEFAIAEAMKKIASFNHQEAEVKGFADPLAVAARAQMMDAETKAREQQAEEHQKNIENILEFMKLDLQAKQADVKAGLELKKKVMDSMETDLQREHDKMMKEKDREMKQNESRTSDSKKET